MIFDIGILVCLAGIMGLLWNVQRNVQRDMSDLSDRVSKLEGLVEGLLKEQSECPGRMRDALAQAMPTIVDGAIKSIQTSPNQTIPHITKPHRAAP